MSDLTRFRDYARAMSTAEHKEPCRWVKPREAERLTRSRPIWEPRYEEDNVPTSLALVGFTEPLERCPGCVTDEERAEWKRQAGEVDAYLSHDEEGLFA